MRVQHEVSLKELRRERKRKRLFARIALAAGIAVALFSGAAVGLRSQYAELNHIIVEGVRVLSDEDIRAFAEETLRGKYAGILPKANIFLFPRRSLRDGIMKTYPRVSDVAVRAVDMRTISIKVTEREPAFLWCGEEAPIGARPPETPCYFADANGFIFDRAPHFSSDVYFEFYGAPFHPKGEKNIVGSYILEPSEFRTIVSFYTKLKELRLRPERFFSRDGAYQIAFSRTDSKSAPRGRLVFEKSESLLGDTIRNLASAFMLKRTERGGEDILNGIEYVDVRFDNKVLFKFRD